MWQEFANNLNELNKAYKALIELGKKKRSALVLVDMKTVESLLKTEEELTDSVARLEKTRQGLLMKLAAREKRLGPDSNMQDIIGVVPPGKMQEVIRKLHDMLAGSVQEAKEISEGNALLIKAAMEAAAFHLNRIGGAKVEPAYGKGGEVTTHRRNFEFNA